MLLPMPKIKLLVISPPDHYALHNLERLRDDADIDVSNNEAELETLAGPAEVILISSAAAKSINLAKLWKRAKSVRWVHSLAAGVDGLLFPELVESNVPLTNARGVFKRPLAEFAVLGLLFHFKRVRRLIDNQRERRWDDFHVKLADERVMGVVGYGEVGRECALLAKGLGMRIQAVRRNPQRSTTDLVLDRVFAPQDLLQMLAQIDVLVCAAPLTADTYHMIGEAQFAVMKPSAIVINVGRGPVIDEAAMMRALQDKRIAGASLDVFEQEPLPESSPLWDMDNVLISPHCTDRTEDPDWLELSLRAFIANFHRYRKGEALESVVDKRAGY
jgi:phosphoglycerate dehydrogenase-like enzyme